jgi:hypothetical protein
MVMRARLLALVLGLCPPAQALGEVYQTPEAFVAEVFGTLPPPRVLWLSREVQAGAAAILDHPPANLRQRYWSDGAKSVWILEEIGKEELITAGFVISQGHIDHARVLAYRESRGQEVRHPSFLKQFAGAGLDKSDRLDRGIDGISGATLSVHAMERMARLALYFERRSRE